MLIPAIVKREEILEAFRRCYYSDDMMYYSCSISSWVPDISEEPRDNIFQFAIVNSDRKLIGYFEYQIDWYSSCAYNFGVVSFDKGNFTIGKDIYKEMERLIYDYKLHRIEYRMVGGNHIENNYDKFCEKFHGAKHVLKDVFKDKYGKYHDDIIYEIIC